MAWKHQLTWRLAPKEHNQNYHRSENLKSHKVICVCIAKQMWHVRQN